jgi:hypothetical protein
VNAPSKDPQKTRAASLTQRQQSLGIVIFMLIPSTRTLSSKITALFFDSVRTCAMFWGSRGRLRYFTTE